MLANNIMKVAQLLSDAIVVVKLLDSWEEETLPPIEQLIASIVLSQGKVIKAIYNIDTC
ncbi:MAG: hypothetical protein WAQ29_07125 [Nitrososphaeraceae archaeon]